MRIHMQTKIKTALFTLALSMISTLSFAECGMDRKLEILSRLEKIQVEREDILRSSRADKRAEQILRSLDLEEKDLINEYTVVCNA